MPLHKLAADPRGEKHTKRGLAIGLVLIAVAAGFGLYRQRVAPPRPPHTVVPFVVICRRAEQGAAGLNLDGIVNELAVNSFPAKVSLTVAVGLQPDRAGRSFQLTCSTPSRTIGQRTLGASFEPDRQAVDVVTFDAIELTRPTAIRFLLSCDGHAMVWRVVPVRQAG